MTFKKRIKKLCKSSKEIDLKTESKIFIYSDCHRGTGDKADDFYHNHSLFLKVIQKYIDENYLLIELGDGDELWENNKFEDILKTYKKIYEIYNEQTFKNKFYFLWGNHNRQWKNKLKIGKKISVFIRADSRIESYESMVLKYDNKSLFLLHGHQGELINDKLWWIGKFFVKVFWRPVQLRFGFSDLTSPAKNFKARIKVDKRYIKWIKETNIPTIIGHTHRPMFPMQGHTPYFNSGSCIHPKGISGIEISNQKIYLVKWSINNKDNKKISKKILGGPLNILNL